VRGTFHLDTNGRARGRHLDLPPTYHIVSKTISNQRATYRIEDGLFTACDVPDPARSFIGDAPSTMDDYARGLAFRAGTVPLYGRRT
jgi:hypothetical protein